LPLKSSTIYTKLDELTLGHAPQNLALLRRLALNALNLEQSYKRSNRQKSHRAAMDNNYMLIVLAGCLFPHDDASRPCCQ
jgi:hypothetical protein